MIISIGKKYWNQAIHYGASTEPESVTCDNWPESGGTRLRWTNEWAKVTCKTCRRRYAAAVESGPKEK